MRRNRTLITTTAARLFSALLILSLFIACSSTKDAAKPDSSDPEAEFQRAEDLINRGYYEEARQTLEDIKSKDTSQQYILLAKLRIADTYYDDEAYEEAIVEYESFLNTYPSHKYAPYAQYKLAMSNYKQIKTPDISYSVAQKALKEFEKLQRNYPRNPYMEVTENRIKACLRVLAEYEFYVGSFYFKKGSYEAAARRFNDLLKNYPGSVIEADALYYLGVSYGNVGQNEKAVSTLNTLIERFPTIKLSSDAREFIASLQEKK